jgi:hypothetical protein
MSKSILVVARFNDGRVLKGSTRDFNPNRPRFHLVPAEGGSPAQVRCAALKALFFVKTFEGDEHRTKLRGFVEAPREVSHGKKIAVRFDDGEVLCGYTLSYGPNRDGFFITPADTTCNNTRIYVVAASTVEVKAGSEAELLVQHALDTEEVS